jgi:hypothetical protein
LNISTKFRVSRFEKFPKVDLNLFYFESSSKFGLEIFKTICFEYKTLNQILKTISAAQKLVSLLSFRKPFPTQPRKTKFLFLPNGSGLVGLFGPVAHNRSSHLPSISYNLASFAMAEHALWPTRPIRPSCPSSSTESQASTGSF